MTTQSRYSAESIEKACTLVVKKFGAAIRCALDGAGSESEQDEFTTFDVYFWLNLRSMLEIYRREDLRVVAEDNPAALAVWDAIFKRESEQALKSKVVKLKRKGGE